MATKKSVKKTTKRESSIDYNEFFKSYEIGGSVSFKKKPKKGCTIVEGFPGFGLIGTICTEYLIKHMNTEKIGTFWFEDMPAAVAIHDGNLVPPIEFHYNAENNIIILHALSAPIGVEWKISEIVRKLAKDFNAKEIISLEGVGKQMTSELNEQSSPDAESIVVQLKSTYNTYYYTNDSSKKIKLKEIAKPIKESIILGVTGALLLKEKDISLSALFVETTSSLPDSKAAAQMISMLDKYLNLNVDPKPLLKTAKDFENKLKTIIGGHKQATEMKMQKQLNYLG
jgi:uncharacterized protein